jgi:hypothetical protein
MMISKANEKNKDSSYKIIHADELLVTYLSNIPLSIIAADNKVFNYFKTY